MTTPYHIIRKTLHEHFAQALQKQKEQIGQSGPLSAFDASVFGGSLATAIGAVRGRNSLHLIDGDDDTLRRFIEKHGLSIAPGSPEHEMLRKELPKAYRDYIQKVLDFNQSLDRYDYSETYEIAQMPVKAVPSVTLHAVVQKYLADGVHGKKWVKRSEAQVRQHLDFLQELVGPATDIKSIAGDKALAVKEALQKLPRNVKKKPSTRNKTLDELLLMEHTDPISTRTVNAYLHDYGGLFAWAVDHHLASDNPFERMLLTETKKNTGDRDAFSYEQLQAIEAALLSTAPGDRPKLEHKWSSLVGVYTGARLNEICQLRITDIKQENGVWYFDINEETNDKQLKTEPSIRIVPVHSRLIDLGFLTYVDRCKNADPTGRLFPSYTYSTNNGYGRNLGRWFNETLLVRLGIKSGTLVFHSLRHTMITQLGHADVQSELVKRLVGHAVPGVTHKHYFKAGYMVAQLKAAIEKFSIYPVTHRNGP